MGVQGLVLGAHCYDTFLKIGYKVPHMKQQRDPSDSHGPKYELDQIDKRLLALRLQYPRITVRQMADVVGIVGSQVCRRIKKPSWIRAFQDFQLETDDLLKEAAQKGARRLRSLVEHSNPTVALKAISLALAPYVNKAELDLKVKPVRIFTTSVQADGSLIQKIIEEDRAKSAESIGVLPGQE